MEETRFIHFIPSYSSVAGCPANGMLIPAEVVGHTSVPSLDYLSSVSLTNSFSSQNIAELNNVTQLEYIKQISYCKQMHNKQL